MLSQPLAVGHTAPVVWMFSGQGAQYFQMGRELYAQHAVFRSWMDRLDLVATDYVGESVVAWLYDDAHGKGQICAQILYTHPALFMVQYALAQTLLVEGVAAPDLLFGASLGEFVAAALAGVATPEALLFDLIRQARLFDAHCSGGAMLVVIDALERFHGNSVFAGGCELAGVYFDRCFVVAGEQRKLRAIANTLSQQGITHQMLPTSIAFHSSHIDGLQQIFGQLFAGSAHAPARIPVMSCAVPDPQAGHERFSSAYWWQVIRQPIQFRQALAELELHYPQALYIDSGPSGNMATFAKYNLPPLAHARIMTAMTPYGNDVDNIPALRRKLHSLRPTLVETP